MRPVADLKRKRAVGKLRRAEQAAEAPLARADYIQAQESVLERMAQLRAERLRRIQGDDDGRKQTNGR